MSASLSFLPRAEEGRFLGTSHEVFSCSLPPRGGGPGRGGEAGFAEQNVEYQGQKAVVSIPDGSLLDGHLPAKKLRLVQAWIDIHEEELMADWTLAVNGESVFPIDPLR